MGYQRPKNGRSLSKAEKLALLAEYLEHCQGLVSLEPSALNLKVPREAFSDLLNHIGEMILRESARLAQTAGPVHDFLKHNPLPPGMAKLLPNEFRSFCLVLNALKQWVAAEQGATDRYLLGGNARNLCREAVQTCLVTGITLGKDAELHHPISKRGHASIEGQLSSGTDDPIEQQLEQLRKAKHQSWVGLRRGCLDLLGKPEASKSAGRASSDRTFARQASVTAKRSYEEILAWLDVRGR
jgi:hypothetical protein